MTTHSLADFLPYLPEDIKLEGWQKAKLIKAYPQMEGLSLAPGFVIAAVLSCSQATEENLLKAEKILNVVQDQLGLKVKPMSVGSELIR